MDRLAEDRALILSFEADTPAQGGAPALPSALGFPAASGKKLAGTVTLSADSLPAATSYVTYSVDGGRFSATTNYSPFNTQWNTVRLPNGLYTLRITAYDAQARALRQSARTIELSNPGATRSPRLTEEQAGEIRARLLALLTPRPSRKAAHFALAERAAQRGDSEAARKHIESVVAIDPLFRNARSSLRRFNLAVLGPRDGIWRARTEEKLVALTFDDGPHSRRTPALLEALAAAGARATFFVVGVRVEESPELLRRMTDEGHEVANHSYSHQNLSLIRATEVERELCRTSVLILRATGKRPRFYRPPGGNFNTGVREAAEALGMAGAYWTVDAIQYENAGSPKALARFVVQETRPGAIILLHNAPDATIAAIPEMVRGLRARGYTLVTMSELVRRSSGAIVNKTGTRAYGG
jgi:peptidoglycan-N-acetylglucosamine deacetylase